MPVPSFAFPGRPILVQAYRAVSGVTTTTEVLNPCGHEVMRFDHTPGFEQVREAYGRPMYPRSRLCRHCQRVPDLKVLTSVSGPPQLSSDWGGLPGKVREEWASVLNAALNAQPGSPDAALWKNLTPDQRAVVAAAGEVMAQRFGLMFHEFLSLNERPAPTLTAAGYRRLKTTPEEKTRRIEKRDQRFQQNERTSSTGNDDPKRSPP